jgi:hypothetical protein
VRNEDVGEDQLGLQILEQVQDLRLDRDVEGGTGSSRSDVGPQGKARAMPMRWRWPPGCAGSAGMTQSSTSAINSLAISSRSRRCRCRGSPAARY